MRRMTKFAPMTGRGARPDRGIRTGCFVDHSIGMGSYIWMKVHLFWNVSVASLPPETHQYGWTRGLERRLTWWDRPLTLCGTSFVY